MPLTIAVNPENPLYAIKDNLTKEEIIKIFSGEYKLESSRSFLA